MATPTLSGEFPTDAFAAIPGEPVPTDLAAELQSVLEELAGEAGVSATVMSADGMWSGATGKADGVRDVTVNDQFSIASITKAVTAAQVMQLVEAGELGLDDPAADHLPPDLSFDTNAASIRDLLGQRSGIPDYRPDPPLGADPLLAWTPAELLATVPAHRTTAGQLFEYGNVNYLLVGLVIEEVSGRPVADLMRDGVLGIEGVERLVYQPDEMPTEPIAIENGRSYDMLDRVGGFLPSLALTSDGAAAAMASDSPSLAQWFRAFCGGEIVSETSLAEMTTIHDGYGLGLYEPEDPSGTVGHAGVDLGYNSLAGCRPQRGVVFAVLVNRNQDILDASRVADALVRALP
jgi:D-alanyl-D-alanine carboxypeptidase